MLFQIIDNQTFNRTYILWPDKLFLNSTQIISNTSKVPQEEITHSKYQPNLPEQNLKTDTLFNVRKYCQCNSSILWCKRQSDCCFMHISCRLRPLVSDYWNVVVAILKYYNCYPWFCQILSYSINKQELMREILNYGKAYYDYVCLFLFPSILLFIFFFFSNFWMTNIVSFQNKLTSIKLNLLIFYEYYIILKLNSIEILTA